MIKQHSLKDFELSQSHLFFWDKLEKASYFLDLAIKLEDEPLEGRLIAHLCEAPVNDGGQYDMGESSIITKPTGPVLTLLVSQP